MRKKIYVAGPVALGNLADNVNRAAEAGLRLLKAGLSPFVPHLSVFFDGVSTRYESEPEGEPGSNAYWARARHFPGGTAAEDWYSMDEPWVKASDALLRLPGESRGADLEVGWAGEAGIPVFYSVDDVVDWAAA